MFGLHDKTKLRQHAEEYARRQRIQVREQFLGWGQDGIVWPTNRESAVKAFSHHSGYVNERDAYLILSRGNVTSIAGFRVPTLVGHNDHLRIVEIGIVEPPYIIDFASAKIHREGIIDDYPEWWSDEEAVAEFTRRGVERFEDDWSRVETLLSVLNSKGIYLNDVNPDNIRVRLE